MSRSLVTPHPDRTGAALGDRRRRRGLQLTGLRARLFLLVLLAIIPCVGLTLYALTEQRRLAVARAGEETIRHAYLVADAESRVVNDARTLLVALSHVPAVTGGDPQACSTYVADLMRHFPEYAAAGVATVDGSLACNTIPLTAPIDVSDRTWFRQALKAGDLSVGEYQNGRTSGKPSLHLGYPVVHPRTDRLIGVAFVALDLARLADHVGTGGEELSRLRISLVDRNGVLLVRRPSAPQWVGRPLPNRELFDALVAGKRLIEGESGDGVRGLHVLAAVGPHEDPYLYAIASMPIDAIVAEIDRSFYASLAALAAVAAVVLVAARAFANALVLHPLEALSTAVERLSDGDLASRAPVRGSSEIRRLADTFNAMADRLAGTIRAEQEGKQSLADQVGCLVAERTRDAESLSRLSELLQACLSLGEAYEVIERLAMHCVGGLSGAVFIISESHNVAEVRAVWGKATQGSSAIFKPEACWALRRGHQHRVVSVSTDPICGHAPAGMTESYTCIPLTAHGETLGIFHLLDRGSDDRTNQRATVLADHIALALANLRLRDVLRNQSIRDPLTGLFNRRLLEESFEREIRRAEHQEQSLGVLMLDIDHFKQFNDSFGHDGGDALLREFGQLLLRHIRGTDVACRYGGEEFTLLLPGANLEVAWRRAEEIRTATQMLRVNHQGHDLGHVTISIGAAVFPAHESTAHGLLRLADAALYRAKKLGRNQTQLAESVSDDPVPTNGHHDTLGSPSSACIVAGAARDAS